MFDCDTGVDSWDFVIGKEYELVVHASKDETSVHPLHTVLGSSAGCPVLCRLSQISYTIVTTRFVQHILVMTRTWSPLVPGSGGVVNAV